jgi:hypothetical protein
MAQPIDCPRIVRPFRLFAPAANRSLLFTTRYDWTIGNFLVVRFRPSGSPPSASVTWDVRCRRWSSCREGNGPESHWANLARKGTNSFFTIAPFTANRMGHHHAPINLNLHSLLTRIRPRTRTGCVTRGHKGFQTRTDLLPSSMSCSSNVRCLQMSSWDGSSASDQTNDVGRS